MSESLVGSAGEFQGQVFFIKPFDFSADCIELFFESVRNRDQDDKCVESRFHLLRPSPASTSAAEARRSEAITGAPDNLDRAFDNGAGSFDGDDCTHSLKFRNVHETIWINAFGNDGDAFCLRHQGNQLGLQVCGIAGMWKRNHIYGLSEDFRRAVYV